MGQQEYTMWSGQGGYGAQRSYQGQNDDHNGQGQRGKPSSDQTIYALRNLKHEFDAKAADYTRMSTAIGDAIALLNEADKLKAEITELKKAEGRRQSADDLAALLAKFGKKDELWFFGDGSGSMPCMGSKGKSAMDYTLGGMEDTAKAAKKAGFNGVKTFLWGDSVSPLELHLDQGSASESAYKNGIGCGTDLKPVANMLASAPAKKKPHYIILSDGDVFDPKEAAPAFGQALGKNPNATIDFIIFSDERQRYETNMEKLASELAKIFPAQVRIAKVDVNNENAFSKELTKLLTARLPQPSAPAKKPAGNSPA